MKLYISDLHYFHDRVIQMDDRGFPDLETMHKYMIQQWNSKVKGGDQVIVLGDFFGSKNPDEVNYVLNRLSGKICLVTGNHDNVWLNKEGVNLDRFEWIKPYAEFDDKGRTVIASHYPIFCYNHQYVTRGDGSPRTYMLYGHVHNTHDEKLVTQFQEITRNTIVTDAYGKVGPIPSQMINCFCKFSDYVPLSLDEWIEVTEKRLYI